MVHPTDWTTSGAVRCAETRAAYRAEDSLDLGGESEALLRSYYEHSPLLMGVVELDGEDIIHLYDNPATLRFFGRAAMPGISASDLGLPADIIGQWRRHYLAAQAGGAPVRFEYRHAVPGASACWLSTVVCYLGPGKSGRPRFSYMAEDITARKRSEEQLRESAERFRQAFQNSPIPVLIYTPGGAILDVSRALTQLTGWTAADLPTVRDWLLKGRRIPAHEVDRVLERMRRDFAGGSRALRPEEVMVWTKSGEVRHWLFHGAEVMSDVQAPGIVASIAVDVTERKRAERALRALLEASAVLAGPSNTREALAQVTDRLVGEYVDWCAIHAPDDAPDCAEADSPPGFLVVRHTRPAQRAALLQHVLRYRAGAIATVERSGKALMFARATVPLGDAAQGLRDRSLMFAPLQAGDKTLGAIALALADTGRFEGRHFHPGDLIFARELGHRIALALEHSRLYRQTQLALERAREADQRKDEFLAMLSHELRNPLAPICSAVSVLKHPQLSAAKVEWARDLIDRQMQHLTRMVDDLLDVSRVTQGKIRLSLAPVDLRNVVERAVEMSRPLLEAKRHRLETRLPRESIWIEGDEVRLTQVVANLLNNAAKYTDEGGRIRVALDLADGMASISVADDGIGIRPDVLPHVFGLFNQAARSLDRAQGGLGIGLTLAQKLVEMHGGTVVASSEGPGKGSEFKVRLPAGGAEKTKTSETMTSQDGPERLRILVVDDNPDATESMSVLLQLEGHETLSALNGPAALEAAPGFAPDVVLLDIGLPGMDGFEVARKLRALPETANTFLVALTGYGGDAARQEGVEAGFDHYLVKPVSLNALLETLARASRGPRAPEAG